MIVKNIKDEIVCEYTGQCSKYNVWSNGSCVHCRNNKYKNPKKNYYKAPICSDIALIVAVLFLLFVIFA